MKKNIEFVILLILSTSIIFSFYLNLNGMYNVDNKFYFGSVGIALSLLSRIKSRMVSNYILGICLILGSFNIVDFSHIRFNLVLFSELHIGLNLIVMFFLLLFAIVNKEIVQKVSGESKELTENEIKEQEEARVMSFMEKNKHKSIEDLQKIVDNPDKYQRVLVDASQRLINENKNKNVL